MGSARSTSTSQLPAQARRRAEHLIELYEREAYRTYNLALRITGDEAAAARATESAFLRHVASGASETADEPALLVRETVTAALTEAPRQGRQDDDQEPIEKAVAGLAPSQRAIIALLSFEQPPEAIAAATGAPPHTAASLTTRASEALAKELQIDVDFVGKRLQEWTLAEPPQAIWESLYPKAHRLLAERDTESAPTDKKTKRSGSALATRLAEGSPGIRRRFTGGFSGRGGVWAFRAGVLAIILVPAVAVALTGPGSKGNGNVALSATGGGSVPGVAGTGDEADHSEGGSTYDALTPKELDQLRLKELDELRAYSEQQTDKSLSQGQRSDAEAQAQQLLELARQRLAEADRRAQQVAAQQNQKQPATKPPATTPTTTTPVPGTSTIPTYPGKKKKKKKKGQTVAPPPDSVSSCLFDPQSGTYICPQ